MAKAWIENNLIFVAPDDIAPKNAVEVPEGTLPQDLKIESGKIVFKSKEDKAQELREKIREQTLNLARSIVEKRLKDAGYYGVGDLKLYADRGEAEAQELLDWYIQFEQSVWNWLENELPQKGFEELTQIDLYSLVEGFSND